MATTYLFRNVEVVPTGRYSDKPNGQRMIEIEILNPPVCLKDKSRHWVYASEVTKILEVTIPSEG